MATTTGVQHHLTRVVSDEDRGPDSIECAAATFGSTTFSHSDCWLDYTNRHDPISGFICGCSCHDPEEERDV